MAIARVLRFQRRSRRSALNCHQAIVAAPAHRSPVERSGPLIRDPPDEPLAGLRADEPRYLKCKCGLDFTVEHAEQARPIIGYVARVLREELPVGLRVSDGMEVPAELAGTIRGSCFVIKGT